MRHASSRACLVGAVLLLMPGPCRAAVESGRAIRPPSHRLGLTPTWTHAFGARSVSHEAIGLGVEMFLGRRMGIALVSALYAPFPRAYANAPSAFPLNETLGSVFPEARITLLRGERAELAVASGAGVIASRPVSLVDPDHRRFDHQAHVMFSVGAVARVFLSRDLAVSLEARHAATIEARENAQIEALARREPSTWYGEKSLATMLEARLGLTIFLSEN